jgi:hypothetical protein
MFVSHTYSNNHYHTKTDQCVFTRGKKQQREPKLCSTLNQTAVPSAERFNESRNTAEAVVRLRARIMYTLYFEKDSKIPVASCKCRHDSIEGCGHYGRKQKNCRHDHVDGFRYQT